MINQQYTNLLYTIKKLIEIDSLKISTLYEEGFFDKDLNCKYNNYRHRFYHQVLKEGVSGVIDADVYRHCMEAVLQDGHILKYINNQREPICRCAIYTNKEALQYVKVELKGSVK